MCHFYICLDLYPSRGNVNSLKSWVEYLFLVMDGPLENLQTPVLDKMIAKAMEVGEHEDVVLEVNDGEYERGDTFLSFHCQALRPIIWMTLLAGYTSAWLKRCVIPSPPPDDITPLVILLAVQLVHRHWLGLLPAMVCRIQNGLRTLMEQFGRRVTITIVGKDVVCMCI